MTRADKLMVSGAWALLAFAVALGVLKISDRPKVAAFVVDAERRLKEANERPKPWVPDVSRCERPSGPGTAGLAAADPFAVSNVPRIYYVEVPLRKVTIETLPRARAWATADLDGATVDWSLEERPMALARNVTRKASKPTAILIERGEGDDRKAIASLDPKATRYVDLTAEPNRAYRYWVVVVGPEVALEGRDDVRKVASVRSEPEKETGARVPGAYRVSIAGGDLQVAVLRVEKYDRTTKTWVSRVVNAKPGEKIGSSGWTLDGLRKVPGRFETTALVADVRDDTGAKRILQREE